MQRELRPGSINSFRASGDWADTGWGHPWPDLPADA